MEDKEFNNLCNFSKKLMNVLKVSTSVVARHLLECADSKNKSIKMLDYKKNGSEVVITYLPIGKSPVYTKTGRVSVKNRQSGKIGKTFKTFLKGASPYSDITDRDLELFVNELKAKVSSNYVFSLVSGEDIRTFYLGGNASSKGSLGNSCMRYGICQSFFDIYVKSPDCQMLIIQSKRSPGKILGRALVWTVDGKKYMDRRYGATEVIEQKLVEYATENKWGYKRFNTYSDAYNKYFMVYDNYNYEERKVNLSAKVDGEVSKFPYCDTLKYYFNGYLHNYRPENGDFKKLSRTNGSGINIKVRICHHCGHKFYDDTEDIFTYEGHGYCCNCVGRTLNNGNVPLSLITKVVNNTGWNFYELNSQLDSTTERVEYNGKVYHILKHSMPYSPLIPIEDSEWLLSNGGYLVVSEKYVINKNYLY